MFFVMTVHNKRKERMMINYNFICPFLTSTRWQRFHLCTIQLSLYHMYQKCILGNLKMKVKYLEKSSFTSFVYVTYSFKVKSGILSGKNTAISKLVGVYLVLKIFKFSAYFQWILGWLLGWGAFISPQANPASILCTAITDRKIPNRIQRQIGKLTFCFH